MVSFKPPRRNCWPVLADFVLQLRQLRSHVIERVLGMPNATNSLLEGRLRSHLLKYPKHILEHT